MTDKPITTVAELIDQCMIKIRIDYLDKNKEVNHIFTNTDQVGRELFAIMSQGATDIHIYKVDFVS